MAAKPSICQFRREVKDALAMSRLLTNPKISQNLAIRNDVFYPGSRTMDELTKLRDIVHRLSDCLFGRERGLVRGRFASAANGSRYGLTARYGVGLAAFISIKAATSRGIMAPRPRLSVLLPLPPAPVATALRLRCLII